MVATSFSVDTPLVVTGWVRMAGIQRNWIWWCLAMGGVLAAFVFAQLWRRSEVMTDVELARLRLMQALDEHVEALEQLPLRVFVLVDRFDDERGLRGGGALMPHIFVLQPGEPVAVERAARAHASGQQWSGNAKS